MHPDSDRYSKPEQHWNMHCRKTPREVNSQAHQRYKDYSLSNYYLIHLNLTRNYISVTFHIRIRLTGYYQKQCGLFDHKP